MTGANKGLGKEVARQLAQAGLRVLIGSRDLERGKQAQRDLRRDQIEVEVVQLDVTRTSSIARAVEIVRLQFGGCDVLVNNAGVSSPARPPSAVDVDDMRTVLETNVLGVTQVTRAFLPLLKAATRPRIVNVSSSRGAMATLDRPEAGAPGPNTAYQTSKAALNALTLLWAKELTTDGIDVNCVDPGPRATDLLRAHDRTPPGAGDVTEGARAIARVALNSPGTGMFLDENGHQRAW